LVFHIFPFFLVLEVLIASRLTLSILSPFTWLGFWVLQSLQFSLLPSVY
jgi:hypothetical protein